MGSVKSWSACLIGVVLVACGTKPQPPIRSNHTATNSIFMDVAGYMIDTGECPESIDDVIAFTVEAYEFKRNDPRLRRFYDRWGRKFVLEKVPGDIVLKTYGRDGKPGGQGDDADYFRTYTSFSMERGAGRELPCER